MRLKNRMKHKRRSTNLKPRGRHKTQKESEDLWNRSSELKTSNNLKDICIIYKGNKKDITGS